MNKISLIGAGSGNSEYLTLKGKKLLQKADVVVYDSLIPDSILKFTKPNCKKIYVGKRKGDHSFSQKEINELLLKLSKENNRIVRLKGGDPFIFGRGGEEIEFLNKHKINYEIVPGISSFQASAALLEIPLTHRKFNHSLQILSGHDLKSINFKSLAKFDGNIIILMGITNLKEICKSLIGKGKNSKTPIAIIGNLNNSLINYEISTLENIINSKKEFKPPGIIFIGEILNYLDDFKQNKPLILSTRPIRENDELIENLEGLGFNVINKPLIKIVENDFGLESLKEKLSNINNYSYLIFTSPTSVRLFFKTLSELQFDIRNLEDIKICSIGPGTEKVLNEFNIYSDFIPNEYSVNGIIELLKPKLTKNDFILVPRSNLANKNLNIELSKIAKIGEIGIYDIQKQNINLNKLINDNKIKFITATSSSIGQNLSTLIDDSLKDEIVVFSIGKETTKSLSGFKNIIESPIYSIDGLIQIIEKYVITNKIKEK